jgi:hypothetical protein
VSDGFTSVCAGAAVKQIMLSKKVAASAIAVFRIRFIDFSPRLI